MMNYLKNRYPFKLFMSYFRIATKGETNSIDIKRNKSDSAIIEVMKRSVSKESLKSGTILQKQLSKSLSECQDIENKTSDHVLKSDDSNNSLPYSKTSSEHSFKGSVDRKKTLLDLHSTETLSSRSSRSTLNKELNFKLKKLQHSLGTSENSSRESEEVRPSLKRAYPWQNFNLNIVHQIPSDEDVIRTPQKLMTRNYNVKSSLSDHSMMSVSSSTSLTGKSSNQSLRSFNSVSSVSSTTERKTANDSLQELKDQMPLFKSILKKSAYKDKTKKEVTFNNISTIYGPKSSYSRMIQKSNNSLESNSTNPVSNSQTAIEKSDNNSLKLANKKSQPSHNSNEYCSGKFEPLKEEYSFLYHYNEKRPKTLL